MNYFNDNEFTCPCCGENETDVELIHMLNNARERAGVPFRITSGYRCESKNKKVGGVDDSAHVRGLAADIYTADSRERFIIIRALLDAGFERVGVSENFIHADIDTSKKQGIIWVY